jgi:hypothetical protein
MEILQPIVEIPSTGFSLIRVIGKLKLNIALFHTGYKSAFYLYEVI